MREIKFRGKDIVTSEWRYGYLRHRIACLPSIIHDYNNNGKIDYAETPVHRDSVGQFTGVYDCDGNEIYEGDIFESEVSGYKVRHYVKYIEGEAMFAAMIIGSSDYCALRQSWIDRYGKKIIGNIHDNPELLNK